MQGYSFRLPEISARAFSKLKEKQDGSKCNGQDIRNRLGHINCICPVSTENIGQDIDQRDDQNKFPDNSHNDGIFGSAKEIKVIWQAIWIPKINTTAI